MFIIFKILAVFNINVANVSPVPDILIFRKDNDVLHPVMTENGGNRKRNNVLII